MRKLKHVSIHDPSAIKNGYTTGDQASNWEFFKDGGKNYASATKLDQKDKKIVAATLLSIMDKECLHVCRNGRKSTTQNGTN